MQNILKIEELKEFKKRNKHSFWIYKLESDFEYQTDLKTEYFESDWLTIFRDGRLRINKDYAWDGCSMKIDVLDLFVVGVPDGVVNIKTMKPKTYYASLVHDALYQYMGYHSITRKQTDQLFRKIMKENNFLLRWIYYSVVRSVGWLFCNKAKKNDGYIFINAKKTMYPEDIF